MSRLTVLVVGLLPAQAAHIARQFPALDIRHQGSHQGTRGLRAVAGGVDHVLVMVRFVTHQHQVIVTQVNRSVVLVPGGLSSLHTALERLTTHA